MPVPVPRHAHSCGRRSRGFTLVEILVAVLLVGVAVAVLAVNFAADDRERLREEAARLALGLEQAQDEVVMTGAALAWRGAEDGYQYLRRSADGTWTPVEDGAFRSHRFNLPVRCVDVEVSGVKVASGGLIVLSPSALAAPARIVLQAEGERAAVEVGATMQVVMGNGV